MLVHMLKSKLHLAYVTGAELNYQGSLSMDSEFMELLNIYEGEQLHVYNNTNGNRYTTYAIRATPGSREIAIHGAGAHLVNPGDRIIICTYCMMESSDAPLYKPKIILLNEKNEMITKINF